MQEDENKRLAEDWRLIAADFRATAACRWLSTMQRERALAQAAQAEDYAAEFEQRATVCRSAPCGAAREG